VKRTKTVLVALVTAGWLFNLVAPAFVAGYEAKLEANAPFMLILGAMFATRNNANNNTNNSNGEE
jgi:hypothetical protein